MEGYNKFINSLLPGNYALTKSMEISKVSDSGTLWYTKKFLTLYYYIFLSNDVMTTAYKVAVIDIFDNYINSLPESVRGTAERYFYPDNDAINFKSDNFNLFSNFASYNIFNSEEERREYYQSAKKYYFALLMGSGGQTGIKKKLKEAVQSPGFIYSHANIDEIILRNAIDVCMKDANAVKEILDNSVKYILSEATMEKACELAGDRPIDEADIRQLNRDFPHENPNYRGIENDMIAFIRNERQILYYYGFFHSKTTGAKDFEFSSLTPVGELALKANASEFLLIWEHQKIKMISQPATVDINLIKEVENSSDSFGISFSPYIDILGHLIRRGDLTLEEYQYIVSRKKHYINNEEWVDSEDEIFAAFDSIKDKIKSFGRQRDIADEDARKELLKYLLGLRNDLSCDLNTNILGVLKMQRSKVSVIHSDALSFIYDMYSRIDRYKIEKNETLFINIEKDLIKRYKATISGQQSTVDSRVKIYWDLYNIHPDNFIMICIAAITSALSLGIRSVEDLSKENIERASAVVYDNYKNLFKSLGIRSLLSVKKEVNKALTAIKNNDFTAFINTEDKREEQVFARYRTEGAEDLFVKIQRVSGNASVVPSDRRERNTSLVSMMKSYYMNVFSENNMLKCECCGEETFITNAGEPYVEFHHLIPFNIAYGPDHYLNLFALCPNCHRMIHFIALDDKKEKYENLSDNNYLNIGFKERLRTLKAQNLLRSYHLEFLLADNAITLEDYENIAA